MSASRMSSPIDLRFFDESTLVVLAPVARPTAWLLKLTIYTVLIFAGYLAGLRGVTNADRPPITTDDEHRQQVIRYLLTNEPQVAFVGSSLTHALKPDYFSEPNYSNLALPGGSPLTGLMLIANSGHLPKVLIIETNILGVKPDTNLLEYFRPVSPALEEPRRLIRDFKPIRTTLCHLMNADPSIDTLHKRTPSPRNRQAYYQERKAALLAHAPSEHDTTEAVNRALNFEPSETFRYTVRTNAENIAKFADQMEAQGVRVYLLDMPLMPEIRDGVYSRTVRREIEKATAARPNRWLRLDLDQSQLRWTDAYHLDERSSILVIQAIEKELQNDSQTTR